jgi:nitric-oxide synthase
VTSTHLISSRSGEGVAAVASKIARERKGRDVFVVGAANVGKSAFVRALLKEMSRWGCSLSAYLQTRINSCIASKLHS